MHAGYEKLGASHLGRTVDPEVSRVSNELLPYDCTDLATQAVCVVMTGSGKTGVPSENLVRPAIIEHFRNLRRAHSRMIAAALAALRSLFRYQPAPVAPGRHPSDNSGGAASTVISARRRTPAESRTRPSP